MAYILSAQRDDEESGDTAFERYTEYLATVREQLPPGARELVDSSWYFGFSDHRAPMTRGWKQRISAGQDGALGLPVLDTTNRSPDECLAALRKQVLALHR